MRKDTRERPRSEELPKMVIYFESAHDRQAFFNAMVDGIGKAPIGEGEPSVWRLVKTWGAA